MKKRLSLVSLVVLVLALSVFMLAGCNTENNENNTGSTTTGTTNGGGDNTTPDEPTGVEASIEGIDDVTVDELTTFDPLAGVTATDADGNEVTVEVAGMVNTLKPGEYELTYTAAGTSLNEMRTVTVNAVEPTLANGVYNYKFATAETRHIFMAAGEDWLLHNQYAGVPLFANSVKLLWMMVTQVTQASTLTELQCLVTLHNGINGYLMILTHLT